MALAGLKRSRGQKRGKNKHGEEEGVEGELREPPGGVQEAPWEALGPPRAGLQKKKAPVPKWTVNIRKPGARGRVGLR